MITYQVVNNPAWSCPRMLVFVDQFSGEVLGVQTNPNNDLTAQWAEEHESWGPFDPTEYAEVKLFSRT